MKKSYLHKISERRTAIMKSLKDDFLKEAYRLVSILRKNKFIFKKIYLFGSVIKNKPLSPWSDIDLAIEGLNANLFYKTYACLLKNSHFPVDLKPFEELDTTLKEKIVKEGKLIYETK